MLKRQVVFLLSCLTGLIVSSSEAQTVMGNRTTSQSFFRGGDELEVTLTLSNPGTAAKAITVVEAVPEGWTVVSAGQGGTTAVGGTIKPGYDQGLLIDFVEAPHFESFNKVEMYWNTGSYPYAGKSTVNRGEDTNETDTPQPLGVRDLQLHPPDNDHNTVAAFIVPVAGSYTVSDLAVRRVHNEGVSVVYYLYNSSGQELVNLTAINDQVWVTDTTSYPLGNLNAGDKIYFAVNRDLDFGFDATEVAFTIQTGTTTWHSYDVMTQAGYPQATVMDEANAVQAIFEFYESAEDFGVTPIVPSDIQVKGPVITWNVNAAPGQTTLTYRIKAPDFPTGSPSWFGISDGFTIIIGWYTVQRVLVKGKPVPIVVLSCLLGFFYGFWAVFWWNEEPMAPLVEFALYVILTTLVLIACYAGIQRLNYTFYPGKPGILFLSLLILLYFFFITIQTQPLALYVYPPLLSLTLLLLFWNRQKEQTSLLPALHGQVPVIHYFILLLIPLVAIVIYALCQAWDLRLATNLVVYYITTPLGFFLYLLSGGMIVYRRWFDNQTKRY